MVVPVEVGLVAIDVFRKHNEYFNNNSGVIIWTKIISSPFVICITALFMNTDAIYRARDRLEFAFADVVSTNINKNLGNINLYLPRNFIRWLIKSDINLECSSKILRRFTSRVIYSS